ncbi:MAG: tetratricopeptide repeat protein [Candidatus Cloacimonadaceae bacterium]|nr:tetratricopeptide repeat protein [Candidatus Cloacimonadaceae bacterium]
MKYLLVLIVIVLVGLHMPLQADHASYIDMAESIKIWVDENPEDDNARLNLGYYYMMSMQPLLALREYRILSNKDPGNLPAQAGSIWALNILKQYSISIPQAKNILKQYPDYAPIHNLLGFAYLKTDKFSSARYHYSRALELEPFETKSRVISYEGLGWAYAGLQNYCKAIRNYYIASTLTPDSTEIYGFGELNEPKYYTTINYTIPRDDREAITLEQSYQIKSYGFKLSMEDFRYRGKHYRYSLGSDFHKQLHDIKLGLSIRYLTGKDDDLYPGILSRISARPDLYMDKYWLKPLIAGTYSQWPRFDVYQFDTGLTVGRDKSSMSYRYCRIYQDNESLGSDISKTVHIVDLTIPIYKGSSLTCSLSEGNRAWYTDLTGNVYDRSDAIDRTFGIYIYVPVAQGIGLGQFNQMGRSEGKWEYLFNVGLTIHY